MSSEYVGMCKLLSGKKSTGIIRYPSGKFGITGGMPIELTEIHKGVYSEVRVSKVFDTEQNVIDALIAVGITHFQKSDCNWYSQ